MIKVLVLIIATLSMSACLLVPVGHDHDGDRDGHEHHDDRDGHDDRRDHDRDRDRDRDHHD